MSVPNREATKPGDRFVVTYKGTTYICEAQGDPGTPWNKLSYVIDGQAFESPSGAGRYVQHNACNGWRFWTREGEQHKTTLQRSPRLTAPRPPKVQKTAATPQPPGATQIIRPMRNQKGTPDAQIRYFCSACMDEAFYASVNDPDPTCGRGHRMWSDANGAVQTISLDEQDLSDAVVDEDDPIDEYDGDVIPDQDDIFDDDDWPDGDEDDDFEDDDSVFAKES